MSMNPHPLAQLSAYLDDALSPVERTAVAAHLDTCGACRARLAELRATASLIGALPDLSPSRRLVPRIAAVPAWLAPLRTLTTMASGVSAFLFIASALLANVGTLAVGTSGAAQPAAAPAAGGASTFERSTTSAVPGQTPAPPAFAASGPSADAASKAAASPTPTRDTSLQLNTSTAAPQDAAARSDNAQRGETQALQRVPQLGPSPWLWLALALVLGAIAIALQRRLRSA